MQLHLVRIGALGHIGQFAAVEAMRYRRGTRVVCRSERGLELGLVLAGVGDSGKPRQYDGTILRKMTVEDELLSARIEKHRAGAFDDCQELLRSRGLDATLIDVELLFDGKSIYFYFLGAISSDVERLTGELAEAYEARVQLRQFGEAIVQGCGPGCGTDEAAGCGENCGSCAVSAACGSKMNYASPS